MEGKELKALIKRLEEKKTSALEGLDDAELEGTALEILEQGVETGFSIAVATIKKEFSNCELKNCDL